MRACACDPAMSCAYSALSTGSDAPKRWVNSLHVLGESARPQSHSVPLKPSRQRPAGRFRFFDDRRVLSLGHLLPHRRHVLVRTLRQRADFFCASNSSAGAPSRRRFEAHVLQSVCSWMKPLAAAWSNESSLS